MCGYYGCSVESIWNSWSATDRFRVVAWDITSGVAPVPTRVASLSNLASDAFATTTVQLLSQDGVLVGKNPSNGEFHIIEIHRRHRDTRCRDRQECTASAAQLEGRAKPGELLY